MSNYEVMYIIDTALEDEPRKEMIERVQTLVTENGGQVNGVDEWGKRRLAYPIDYKTDGYYVLMHFSSDPEFPRELERNLQISDSVIRYLVTKQEA